MKLITTLVIVCILISPSLIFASDIALYMWDQEISGTAFGRDSSLPGSTTRVDASINEESNSETGFRLVSRFLGAPTEFGYLTMSNSTSLDADGTFSFNGRDFDFSQPLDLDQDIKIYEFFPRLSLLSTDKIGLNLLLGVKVMDFQARIAGTEQGTGIAVVEEIDEFVPLPQIGVRCFIGSLKKGLRIELMAKYLKLDISGVYAESLDAEAIAYVKAAGGIDAFFGWKTLEQKVIVDENEASEAGIDIKNSGLVFGGRIRF